LFLIIFLSFVAPELGPSIREGGWDERALSTLIVVGESCRVFLRKLECTADLETLTATPVEGVRVIS